MGRPYVPNAALSAAVSHVASSIGKGEPQLVRLLEMFALAVERLGVDGELFTTSLEQAATSLLSMNEDAIGADLTKAGIPSFVDAVSLLVIGDMILDELADLGLRGASRSLGPSPWRSSIDYVEESEARVATSTRDLTIRLDLSLRAARNRCVAHVEPGHQLSGRWSADGFRIEVTSPRPVPAEIKERLQALGAAIPDFEFILSGGPYADYGAYAWELTRAAHLLSRTQRKELKNLLSSIGMTVVSPTPIVDDLLALSRRLSGA